MTFDSKDWTRALVETPPAVTPPPGHKIFVILETGNEAGSAEMVVERPG